MRFTLIEGQSAPEQSGFVRMIVIDLAGILLSAIKLEDEPFAALAAEVTATPLGSAIVEPAETVVETGATGMADTPEPTDETGAREDA